jgi:hypothetical protein
METKQTFEQYCADNGVDVRSQLGTYGQTRYKISKGEWRFDYEYCAPAPADLFSKLKGYAVALVQKVYSIHRNDLEMSEKAAN